MRAIFLAIIVAGCVFVAPVLAADVNGTALTYSRWMKLCGSGTCFVGVISHISSVWCLPRVRAVLTTRRGQAAQTLQITLTDDVDRSRGLRLRIDQDTVIERPYAVYADNGCMAEISGPDLVDRLKQGHTLIAEAVNTSHAPIAFSLPLDGFAAAYDGPSLAELKAFKVQSGKLAEELAKQKQQPQPPPRRSRKCGPD